MQARTGLDFRNGVPSLAGILCGAIEITQFWLIESSQMTAPNSCRTKCRRTTRPRSGNPSPFGPALCYGEFVMATGFSIDRHSRKLFGLESGVKTELIRHRPVLSSMLAISKFEIRGQKIVGFFMNFRRGSGGSHGGRDFFLCRVLGFHGFGFEPLAF